MNMRHIFSLILGGLLVAASATAASADSAADRLQKRYASIDAMRAGFTQVLVHKESGSRETRSGTLAFKKPLNVRWETKKPDEELLVINDKVIWNVFPDEEMAYKYAPDLAQDSRSIVRVVTGQTRLNQDFDVEMEGVESGLSKMRLYPKEATQSMVEVLLWVDAKTDLIKKIRIYDFYGNENEITFSGHDTAAKLPDSLFTYTPPKAFVIEDKTKESGGERLMR